MNTQNNKIYIGQSHDIKGRLDGHKRKLKNNKHNNIHLQSSWNKYGENNFKFNIIEICEENLLNEREIYWINYFDCLNKNKGFNIKEGGSYGKHSEQTKKKISELQIGRKAWNKNKPMSEEQKIKLSISHKNKQLSEQHKNNISKSLKGVNTWNINRKNINKITFTQDEYNLILALKFCKMSNLNIGNIFGCSKPLISKILKDNSFYIDNIGKNLFPIKFQNAKTEGGYSGPTKSGLIVGINTVEDVQQLQDAFNEMFENAKKLFE